MLISALFALTAQVGLRQEDPNVYIPPTSRPQYSKTERLMHTNFQILTGPWKGYADEPLFASIGHMVAPSGFGPADLKSAYNMPITGYAANRGTGNIAIVIAYHYTNAMNHFNIYSNQFGLPVETSIDQTLASNRRFQVVYQGTTAPTTNTGWNQEAALDIEMAHAMNPYKKIYLVEANSNSDANLIAAIDKAVTLPGVSVVSMSWGGTEAAGDTANESHFISPGKVFMASSGDVGGEHSWPAMSPNVLSIGGTHLVLSGSTWTETAWSSGGGGLSSVFARPAYQNGVVGIVGAWRGGPDISGVADPATGVAVYTRLNSTTDGWAVFGGTSVSAPMTAGIYGFANPLSASTAAEGARIYSHLGQAANFRDVTGGSAGSNPATVGYDLATGVGTPQGIGGL